MRQSTIMRDKQNGTAFLVKQKVNNPTGHRVSDENRDGLWHADLNDMEIMVDE